MLAPFVPALHAFNGTLALAKYRRDVLIDVAVDAARMPNGILETPDHLVDGHRPRLLSCDC